MKAALLSLLLCAPALVAAQIDTAAIEKQVDSLYQLGLQLGLSGKLDEGIPLAMQAKGLCEAKLGNENLRYARCLTLLGRFYTANGQPQQAMLFFNESIALFEKLGATEHPDYAEALVKLASVISQMEQRTEESFELLLKAKAVYDKTLDHDHPKYADLVLVLGVNYFHARRYREAEPYMLQARDWAAKTQGKESAQYAAMLTNLGNLNLELHNFKMAESLYHESKAILEKIGAQERGAYQINLFALAGLLALQGRDVEAENLVQAIKAYLKKYPDPTGGNGFTRLGQSFRFRGNFAMSEKCFLEAKALKEKLGGSNGNDYAVSLTQFAFLYWELGLYEKTEPLLQKALAIRENIFGKKHYEYCGSLINLAVNHDNLGRHALAQQMYLEALSILENDLGMTKSDFYLKCLNNLASNFIREAKFEAAKDVVLKALSIKEKTGQVNDLVYASIHSNLGWVYFRLKDNQKCEQHLKTSLALHRKILGNGNPRWLSSIRDLAVPYHLMGRYEEAEPLFLEMDEIQRQVINRATRHLSVAELEVFQQKIYNKDFAFSFAALRSEASPQVASNCFDQTLFYKGFLLSSASTIRRLSQADPAAKRQLELLTACHSLLAQEQTKPLAEQDSAAIASLEEKANAFEKQLVTQVAGFGAAIRQVNWQEVQEKLKPGEAAIEFIDYHFHFPNLPNVSHCSALLLRPNDTQPQFIFLCDEASLDSLLHLHADRRSDYVNDLYAFAERGAKPLGKPQKSLYELIWQPLEKELAGVQTIYFSPSGLLHRLNLGAIPISEEETLSDRYRLVGLGSTRQLVIPSEVKVASQDALVFGGVQYEMDSTAIAAANVDFGTDLLASRGGLSFSYADSTNRGGTWNYLKWTEREVTSLEPILKSGGIQPTIRKGYTATEESFKSIGKGKPSPRILHIATHGFFFPDPKSEVRGERVRGEMEEPVFKISEHPMIRSGLILAGGNQAWKTGKPLQPDMEDGILTAYEISQMNLSNTELVVLSACETGLGDIEGNEGVYGLQRAFKIAGAKYLIMSLWQVPDFQTQELMTTFYKNWLGDKMTLPDAFRSAQREMREKYQNPYFWAGFVLVE